MKTEIDIPDSIKSKLLIFDRLLHDWHKAKNLVSKSTMQDLWRRHFLDSYQLIRLRSKHLASLETEILTNENWLDIGSGAGLPGMVIAIAASCAETQSEIGSVTLVEANARKCAFMSAVSRETHAPAIILNTRIESLSLNSLSEKPDVITARALAPLPKLCSLLAPLMAQDTVALVHKGQDFVVELEKTAKIWDFTVVQHQSVVDESSVILEISNLKKR